MKLFELNADRMEVTKLVLIIQNVSTRCLARLHKSLCTSAILAVMIIHVETLSKTSNRHYLIFERSSSCRLFLASPRK